MKEQAMIRHYIYLFSVFFAGCDLCAQLETNNIKIVDPGCIAVNKVEDDRHESLAVLFKKYKSSKQQSKRYLEFLMSERSNADVSYGMDEKLCDIFIETPNAGTALLLGMCNSTRSLNLLQENLGHKDAKITDACRLGLARRGDSDAEEYFVQKHAQAVKDWKSREERGPHDALDDSIQNLEYIGSAVAILAIFDNVELLTNTAKRRNDTKTNMIAYISEIGLSVPSNLSNDAFAQWWKDNRELVKKVLLEMKDLPRMKRTRVIHSID